MKDIKYQAGKFELDLVGNRVPLRIFEWESDIITFLLNANDKLFTMSSVFKIADPYASLEYCLSERMAILLREEANFKWLLKN